MRLRATVAVSLLLLASPAVATAADGQFRYLYNQPSAGSGSGSGPANDLETGALRDPESGRCLNLRLPNDKPAFEFRNQTRSTVAVFQGRDCAGDHFVLEPREKSEYPQIGRSVYFS
ncbi:hypothetical protein [Actinosynnema sp. NPDC020468]|uniref:hypothetical protein n=1 Tax=Actinosynnema sp. NPDC020468 TaxID=3154488 RepID=UPI0033F8946F